MDQVIPYGKQEITDADKQAVLAALESDFLTQGPRVNHFEEKFASYVDCKYAVAVSNGTAALHLAALALGVGENSNIITTPITFAASSNCILYCGGNVTFGDIDPTTGTLSIDSVRAILSSKPRGYFHGIIPVDLAGYPINIEEFREVAVSNGLWLMEDACHAPGGFFTDRGGNRQNCGNARYSEVGIFSFHPVKHIAMGEGGMITTNDLNIYEKLLKLRTHGITKDPRLLQKNEGGWYYEMQELGFNYRVPDILCALGISQLERLEESIQKRQSIARKYDHAFEDNEWIRPLTPIRKLEQDGKSHAYHLYVVRTKHRLELYNFLKSKNIFAQVHYIPVYNMPYYRAHGFGDVWLPNAEAYYEECLSLPMYPSLTESQQNYVIESILKFTRDL